MCCHSRMRMTTPCYSGSCTTLPREPCWLHRCWCAPSTATENQRGGRQIAPMLRLMSGDLVLDEPDDFDIADLPALTRLVHWAGLLGMRVLLSPLPDNSTGSLPHRQLRKDAKCNRCHTGDRRVGGSWTSCCTRCDPGQHQTDHETSFENHVGTYFCCPLVRHRTDPSRLMPHHWFPTYSTSKGSHDILRPHH